MVIAIKKLNQEDFQGHREWLAEVNYLRQFSHPNLVRLVGYCLEDEHRLLVYEFMPRGSLENHLFRSNQQPTFLSPSFPNRQETAMVARCPSADGQGPADVETPSTPSPSRWRPGPSPIQRPHHPSAPPRSSAARALQPPRARSRGEELPATSLSSAGKPAGRPCLLLSSARTHARRDDSPHSWVGAAQTPAATHHPFLGSCGVDAGGKRRRVPGGGERKWISGGCARW